MSRLDDATLRARVRELPVAEPRSDARARLLAAVRAEQVGRGARGVRMQGQGRRLAWAAAALVVVGAGALGRARGGEASGAGVAAAGRAAAAVVAGGGAAAMAAGGGAAAVAESDRPAGGRAAVAVGAVPRVQLLAGQPVEHRTTDGREVIEIRDVVLRLDVPPLAGERWIVASTDTELECSGGAFTAIAEAGRMRRLDVVSGQVVVRRPGRTAMTVAGGEQVRWGETPFDASLGRRGGGPAWDATAPGSSGRTSPVSGRGGGARGSRGDDDVAPRSAGRGSAADPGAARTPDRGPDVRGLERSAGPGGPRLPSALSAATRAAAPPGPGRAPLRPPLVTPTATITVALEARAPTAEDELVTPEQLAAGRAAPRRPVVPDAWEGLDDDATDQALEIALETRFLQGWSSLRRGSDEAAATAFGDVVSRGGQRLLAEEAAHHQIIALLRAGAPGRAEVVVRRQLARWPDGRRAGASALLLAQQLPGPLARPWLEIALRDRDPTVRASAQARLDDL